LDIHNESAGKLGRKDFFKKRRSPMDFSCPKNFFVFFLLSLLPFPLERRNKLGKAADIRNVKGTLLYGNSGAQQSSSLTRAHQSDERLWAAGLERVVGNR
jgi:hypothetical protein